MMPDDKEFSVSLGVYEIDLNNKTQRNMFSGYERKLEQSVKKENTKLDFNMSVSQNHEGGEIKILYEKSKLNVIDNVKQFFYSKLQER